MSDIAQFGATYNIGQMTLRDYFAAAALPAVLTLPLDGSENLSRPHHLVAKVAYLLADAMLAEREKSA